MRTLFALSFVVLGSALFAQVIKPAQLPATRPTGQTFDFSPSQPALPSRPDTIPQVTSGTSECTGAKGKLVSISAVSAAGEPRVYRGWDNGCVEYLDAKGWTPARYR
jgi:hypothetical protein